MFRNLIVFLFSILIIFNTFAGDACIFGGGNDIYCLKQNLRFKASENRIYTNDTDDPRIIPKSGIPSDLYLQKGTGYLYIKKDSGISINWAQITDSDTPGTIREWLPGETFVTGEVSESGSLLLKSLSDYTSAGTIFLDLLNGNQEILSSQPFPTGLKDVPTVVINGGNFDVGPGSGLIANYTNSVIPAFQFVDWTAQSCAIPDLNDWNTIYIDSAGTLQCSAGPPGIDLYYTHIVLAAAHPEIGEVDTAGIFPGNPIQQFVDNLNFIGPLIDGGAFNGNANLTFNRAASSIQHTGANQSSSTRPNVKNLPAQTPVTFVQADSAGILTGTPITNLDVVNYQPNGTGPPVALTNNRFTYQRLYSTLGGQVVALYGQQEYLSLDEAVSAVTTDANLIITNPSWDNTLIWAGAIVYGKNETSLVSANVEFINCEGQGCQAAGGGAGGAGGGDFFGPASSTTDDLVVFASTTGKVGKDSGLLYTDLVTVNTAFVAKDNYPAIFNTTTGRLVDDGTADFMDFNFGIANPTYTEGRLFYDNANDALSYYTDQTDVVLNIGQENWFRALNNTGVQINNGQVVRVNGALGGVPTIVLAQADINLNAVVAGVATQDIPNGSQGFVTFDGLVRDIDTSGLIEGASVFLSGTTPGGLTSTLPKIVSRVGKVLITDAVNGIVQVSIENLVEFPNFDGNVIKNNGIEFGVDTNYTYTMGTAVNITVDPLIESVSAEFDATVQNDEFVSNYYTIPVGLQGDQCMAAVTYLGGDENLTFQVEDLNGLVIDSAVLSTVVEAKEIFLLFSCPTITDVTGDPNKGQVRVKVYQQTATDAAAIRLDEFYLGEFQSNEMVVQEEVEELRANTLSYTPASQGKYDWSNVTKNTISECGTVTINDGTNRFTYTGKKKCKVTIDCSVRGDITETTGADILLDGVIQNGSFIPSVSTLKSQPLASAQLLVEKNQILTCNVTNASGSVPSSGNDSYLTLTAQPLPQIATIVPSKTNKAGFWGSKEWQITTSGDFTVGSGSWSDFTLNANSDNNPRTFSGYAIADASLDGQLPQITLSKYPKGVYNVVVNGSYGSGSANTDCALRAVDSNGNISAGDGSYSSTDLDQGNGSFSFTIENNTDSTDVIIKLQGRATTSCFIFLTTGGNIGIIEPLKITVYYYPDLSVTSNQVYDLLPIVKGTETVVEEFRAKDYSFGTTNTYSLYYTTVGKNTISQCGTITNTSANGIELTATEKCLVQGYFIGPGTSNSVGNACWTLNRTSYTEDCLGKSYSIISHGGATNASIDFVSVPISIVLNPGDKLSPARGASLVATVGSDREAIVLTAIKFGTPGVITNDSTVESSAGSTAQKVRVESCYITNNGTAAIASDLCNGWVDSVSRTGAGLVDVTIKNAIFSQLPECQCTVNRAGAGSATECFFLNASNILLNILSSIGSTGAASDVNLFLSCRGK